MSKLFLLRHLKSQWNKENRFAGWVDNPLSDEGRSQAEDIAKKLINLNNGRIDKVYSNALIRCTETIVRIYERIPDVYPLFLHLDGGKMQEWGNFSGLGKSDIPVYVSEKLNERYYGQIQGMDKEEIKLQHGEETVQRWRRGYDDKPPGGESMRETYDRVIPFYQEYIEKDLAAGKDVLLVASHNSLRAVVKHIEQISDDNVVNLELPFGSFTDYEFDQHLILKEKKFST